MKKILATILSSIIGISGVACIDYTARDMAETNSQKIEGYYSEYKEDYSTLSESITECSHVCNNYDEDISNLNNKIDNIDLPECSCKDYSHLEEQYNELYSKYEELSKASEENKPKEYKVGDIIEIPVYKGTEKIDTLKCSLEILEVNPTSIKYRYKVRPSFSGYFYTDNHGENVSSYYNIHVKAEFCGSSGYESSDACYGQTETVRFNGKPCYADYITMNDFVLSSFAVEDNLAYVYIPIR